MLILLRCGTLTHMYECSSYSNLKAIAYDAFHKFIEPGNEIGLQYTFRAPVDGIAEKEVIAFVNSQSCFDTFLKVWDEFVKPKQIQQQQHILPVLDVVQTPPIVVPESPPRNRGAAVAATEISNASQVFARTTPAAVAAAAVIPPAPNPSSATTTKSARVKGAAPSSSSSSLTSAANSAPSGSTPEDMYVASHNLAMSLLSSFKQSDPIEPPSIRLVMRCGETSTKIPFDPSSRPDLVTLQRTCKDALIARLASDAEEAKALRDRQFILSASVGDCATEIDLDDNADIALLCDAIRKSGNDYSCFLIADLRGEDDEQGSEIPLPPSFIVDSVLHLDHEMLEVNLCHTPKRERDRKKANGAEGAVDCRGVIVPPTKEV